MRQRLISAAVLVPVVAVLFWLGPPWLTLGLCVLGALAAYESVLLLRATGLGASWPVAVVATPVVIYAFAWSADHLDFFRDYAIAPVAIGLAVIAAAVPALRLTNPADCFRSWLGTTIATLYPAMLGFAAMLIGVAPDPGPPANEIFGFAIDSKRLGLLVLIATVWSLDSAAYIVGRFCPRGRFFSHISPKKTWSGAIGGTIGAMVVCAALFVGSDPEHSLMRGAANGAFFGLVIALAAQLGDLTESMLKRAAGAKDSGTLIPGHGGFLDRVDSFLFAAPAFVAALVIVNLINYRPYP